MEELRAIGQAFADATRLKVLGFIQRHGDVCVCEITDSLELSQPLVSRHLRTLRSAGLVQSRKEGKWMIYSLASPLPEAAGSMMAALESRMRDAIPQRIESCAARRR
jgi:ArsR family transcriptional regulator